MAQSQTSPPVILIMGPPASGKGTQARFVQERHGFARIETGAMLREIAREASPLGQQVKSIIDVGRLAPPPLVADIVISEARRMLKKGQGVVFDGSPRSLFEAELLLAAMRADHREQILVVMLDVDEPETVHRILHRWVCVGCRNVDNVSDDAIAHACSVCGGTLVRRVDDTPEVMKSRWEEYRFRTLPVIEYFERQGLVVRVNGNRSIPDVTQDVQRVIDERLSP